MDPLAISWRLVELAENRRMSRKNREMFRAAAKALRESAFDRAKNRPAPEMFSRWWEEKT